MSGVRVQLPTALRPMVDGRAEVDADGATVADVLEAVVRDRPRLGAFLFVSPRTVRSSVAVFVNDVDMRQREREATPLRPGDVLTIVPILAGGRDDGPPEKPESFSAAELHRYSRHLLLPEVGIAGQRRLRAGKVLVVGAGGLGSPAAIYLAAAGVGTLGLVDFDRVEASNLQRQILYGTRDIGRPKLEAARDRLTDLNPEVTVRLHPERLDRSNAREVIGAYDVVVDGTDNFATRYLVNDAAVLLGRPNVYGSIYRFEGQASVFDARRGPCYRCLYPEPPPPGLVPSCAEAGVLGVLPGLIGTIQAAETVKLLLGRGETLVGRLLLFDALAMRFRELSLTANPQCVLCGPEATQKDLVDYPAFCGRGAEEEPGAAVPEISAEELAAILSGTDGPLLVDVREAEEWAIAHLPGALHIPQGDLGERLSELTGARELVIYCKSGRRSAAASRRLRDLGFTRVRSLKGGIDAWTEEVDPTLPRY